VLQATTAGQKSSQLHHTVRLQVVVVVALQDRLPALCVLVVVASWLAV